MRSQFDEAEIKVVTVPRAPKASDVNDQHVVDATLLSGARYLVTENTRDFPEQELKTRGIEVVTSDAFLMELMQERGDEMVEILCIYAEYGSQPPAGLEEVWKGWIDRTFRCLPNHCEGGCPDEQGAGYSSKNPFSWSIRARCANPARRSASRTVL